jgi:hypothetical protein
MMRDLAERKLAELDLREACKVLTQAAMDYKNQHGAPPKNLEEMAAAGIIDGVPVDPLGGAFFVEQAGKVLSTTLLDVQVERNLKMLRGAIDEYKKRHEQWPNDLEELVTDQILQFVPPHPYPNQAWNYDAATGTIGS